MNEPTQETEKCPELRRYLIYLCDDCINAVPSECHTSGCALWIHRAPDIPILVEKHSNCELADPIIDTLTRQRDELLEALKECRDAAAAGMRVCAPTQYFTDALLAELEASGVKDGFGKRADEIITRIEAEIAEEIAEEKKS